MIANTILQDIGLSAEQIRIYMALLSAVQASISEIAKITGLHRPSIYHQLPGLIERGLISQTQKGKRKLFVAESPEHLHNVIKRLDEKLDTSMPELMSRYRVHDMQPMIRYFQGPEGIRQAYEDLLSTIKKGDIVYRYESPQDYKTYNKYKPREYYDRILTKREVEWLIITNDSQRDLRTKRYERLYKTVPHGAQRFTYDISQYIYRNKVAFIDYKHEVVSIIESETFSDFQRKIFKLLFDRL